MRRTYNRDRYLERVAMIREAIPDLSLTTDIIVGFPGENENDFEQTLALVEEAQFDAAYTFIYSPRRGTEAALLTEELVSAEEASERIGRLIEVVQRVATARAQRFVGRSVEVLVEGQSRTDPERLRGRSRHNKAVNFSGVAVPGDLVEVEIEGATSTSLKGQATLVASALR
jgi:tRNA-2-methylthio-N6-dimethylallyladenosine synthase